MVNDHETGYKDLFHYPELVQQLIEGFAPPSVAALMDFTTLSDQSGNAITPLFNEWFEGKVWSVAVSQDSVERPVSVYLLLEFQSTVDDQLPFRLLDHVTYLYAHLIKTRLTTPDRGLPPIFPVVLYNGSKRWTAQHDIGSMIGSELPAFLRVGQLQLRYHLVDVSAFSDAQLAARNTLLSGVFAVENASKDLDALQVAVERLAENIREHPEKMHLDPVITHWFKRQFERLGPEAGQALEGFDSLMEDHAMLAENLQGWAEKERQKGRLEGRQEGCQEALRLATMNLLKLGLLTDEQIADTTGLSLAEVGVLRLERSD